MFKQNMKNETFSSKSPSVFVIAKLREKNNKGTKKLESRNFTFNVKLFRSSSTVVVMQPKYYITVFIQQ